MDKHRPIVNEDSPPDADHAAIQQANQLHVSNDELIDVMLQVKEGKMTMDQAVLHVQQSSNEASLSSLSSSASAPAASPASASASGSVFASQDLSPSSQEAHKHRRRTLTLFSKRSSSSPSQHKNTEQDPNTDLETRPRKRTWFGMARSKSSQASPQSSHLPSPNTSQRTKNRPDRTLSAPSSPARTGGKQRYNQMTEPDKAENKDSDEEMKAEMEASEREKEKRENGKAREEREKEKQKAPALNVICRAVLKQDSVAPAYDSETLEVAQGRTVNVLSRVGSLCTCEHYGRIGTIKFIYLKCLPSNQETPAPTPKEAKEDPDDVSSQPQQHEKEDEKQEKEDKEQEDKEDKCKEEEEENEEEDREEEKDDEGAEEREEERVEGNEEQVADEGMQQPESDGDQLQQPESLSNGDVPHSIQELTGSDQQDDSPTLASSSNIEAESVEASAVTEEVAGQDQPKETEAEAEEDDDTDLYSSDSESEGAAPFQADAHVDADRASTKALHNSLSFSAKALKPDTRSEHETTNT